MLNPNADLRSLNEKVECRVEPDEPRFALTIFWVGVILVGCFWYLVGGIR